MKKLLLFFIIGIMNFLFMNSCKPGRPSGILSSGTMEDILYDYHIAQGMARGDGKQMIAYEASILKKNDVTKAEFDSSLAYYMRHTEQLHKIYENLSERLDKEVVSLGGSSSIANYGASEGDTANIWRGQTASVLSPEKPFNYESFEIKADTSFHKGDRFILDFDAQFIYQDGMRDGVAVLAVQFGNDSIASQIIRVQSTSHFSTTIQDQDSLGIKFVRGYFLLNRGQDINTMSSTLKLMIIDNIRLVKMHVPTPSAPANSIDNSTNRNSDPSGSPVSPQPMNAVQAPSEIQVRTEKGAQGVVPAQIR